MSLKVGDRVALVSDAPHWRRGTVTNVDRQHERAGVVSVLYDTDPVGSGRFTHGVLVQGLRPLSVVDDLAGLA